MKARLVRIGNSRGIRLPKPLIEQAGLGEEVELLVQEGAILIQSTTAPRTGWADAARHLAHAEGTGLLDAPLPTKFDEGEWKW